MTLFSENNDETPDDEPPDDETPDDDRSVTEWIRDGNDDDFTKLFERYFDALMNQLSRWRKRRFGDADEEDFAQETFTRLFDLLRDPVRKPPSNRKELWKLLCEIALGKQLDHIRKMRAAKRGGGKTRGDSVLIDRIDGDGGGFDGREDENADLPEGLVDDLDELMDKLDNDPDMAGLLQEIRSFGETDDDLPDAVSSDAGGSGSGAGGGVGSSDDGSSDDGSSDDGEGSFKRFVEEYFKGNPVDDYKSRLRAVFVLRGGCGYKNREVAVILGLPITTVEYLWKTVLEKLRDDDSSAHDSPPDGG